MWVMILKMMMVVRLRWWKQQWRRRNRYQAWGRAGGLKATVQFWWPWRRPGNSNWKDSIEFSILGRKYFTWEHRLLLCLSERRHSCRCCRSSPSTFRPLQGCSEVVQTQSCSCCQGAVSKIRFILSKSPRHLIFWLLHVFLAFYRELLQNLIHRLPGQTC